jgi:hypothetical protein
MLTMVTTTSTSQDLGFVINDLLWNSDHPEDKELAKVATTQMNNLVQALKPILRYVDQPPAEGSNLRVVKIYKAENKATLVLTREGKWAALDGETVKEYADFWVYFPFDQVLAGLQAALDEALAKREQHTQALRTRGELLQGINALIEKTTQPASAVK